MSWLGLIEDALGLKLDSEQVLADLESDHGGWEERLWRAFVGLPHISESERRDLVPERRPGVLSPYFPRRMYGSFEDSFVGDLPKYRGLTNQGVDAAMGAAAIGRHLLYCDSVVIDDPMWWVLCDGGGMSVKKGQGAELGAKQRSELGSRRRKILQWLDLVRILRPLLASGRLVVVPFALEYWWGNPPSLVFEDDDALHLQAEFVERMSDDERHLRGDVEFWARVLGKQALLSMSVQLRTSLYFGASLDVSPIHGSHVVALRRLLEHGAESLPTDVASNVRQAPSHRSALQTLGSIPVYLQPGTDVQRLVSLAADDEAFHSWRQGMKGALTEIGDLDVTKPTYESSVLSAFESNLHEPVRRIRLEREKATIGAALHTTVSRLGLAAGSYVAALGLALAFGLNPVIPLAVAATTAATGAKALWTYGRGSAARAQGAAVESLFTELTGGGGEASNRDYRAPDT